MSNNLDFKEMRIAELRKRAEAVLKHSKKNIDKYNKADIKLLIQELQIYQIELEMQNEDLRNTQAELEESRKKYTNLYETAPIGYITINANGIITQLNNTVSKMLETDKKNLINRGFSKFVDAEFKDYFHTFRKKLQRSHSQESCELRLKSVNNIPFFARMIGIATFDLNFNLSGFNLLISDISQRKNLELQLMQSQKMEAIGKLAGGIAHDFNNVLAGILGYAELSLLEKDIPEKLKKNTEQIVQASKRGKAIVEQILAFSKAAEPQRIPVSLSMIINETIQFLSAIFTSNVTITTDLDPSTPMVLADPNKIHQVLLNLCTNSYQAFEGSSGKIHISLKQIPDAQDDDELATPKIELTVSDNGPGMEQAVLERIFDPFFSTKSTKKNTGLGLSVVYSIVRTHNGSIHFQSEKGSGTTATVVLNAINKNINSPEIVEKEIAKGNYEHILLVDDELFVTNVKKQLLEYFNYKVTATNSPEEALELIKSKNANYDVLLTDLTMPKMDGLALSAAVRKENQFIPILIMTGFGESISQTELEELRIRKLLKKPVDTNELCNSIYYALH